MTPKEIDLFSTYKMHREMLTVTPAELIGKDDPTGHSLTTGLVLKGFDELAKFYETTLKQKETDADKLGQIVAEMKQMNANIVALRTPAL